MLQLVVTLPPTHWENSISIRAFCKTRTLVRVFESAAQRVARDARPIAFAPHLLVSFPTFFLKQ